MLGGLITDDRMTATQKVPLLVDIPIVGNLFKSRQESQTKRTLFIFLKPTILRDTADAVQADASPLQPPAHRRTKTARAKQPAGQPPAPTPDARDWTGFIEPGVADVDEVGVRSSYQRMRTITPLAERPHLRAPGCVRSFTKDAAGGGDWRRFRGKIRRSGRNCQA